jgi:(p)ppGpp synthase/HD superfamily hydrolase
MATLPCFWDESLPVAEMMELEVQLYSKSQIANAGKLLAGTIPAAAMHDDSVREAFKIAWNWRNSHILPMRKLRAELSRKAKRVNSWAVAAARPKRMRSIRQKLDARSLYDIQDIAGCRAIMPTIGEVRALLAAYEESAKHSLHKPYDYIANPRDTGYRCFHLVYKFEGETDEEREAFRHHYVELQLRTQLQHAWATAVVSGGLVI